MLRVYENRRLEEQALSTIVARLGAPTSRQMFYQRYGAMSTLQPINDADRPNGEFTARRDQFDGFACILCLVDIWTPPTPIILPCQHNVAPIWAEDWAKGIRCIQRKTASTFPVPERSKMGQSSAHDLLRSSVSESDKLEARFSLVMPLHDSQALARRDDEIGGLTGGEMEST
jgi:hypothetical protein